MNEKQKATLSQLAITYFELADTRKELNGKINDIKSEMEAIVSDSGVTEITIDKLKFTLNSKQSRRFKKSEFAKDVGVDKCDVSEKLIAELVEKKATSSVKVGSFLDIKSSRSFKIKKQKEKRSKK